jgi:hypothetical protein
MKVMDRKAEDREENRDRLDTLKTRIETLEILIQSPRPKK